MPEAAYNDALTNSEKREKNAETDTSREKKIRERERMGARNQQTHDMQMRAGILLPTDWEPKKQQQHKKMKEGNNLAKSNGDDRQSPPSAQTGCLFSFLSSDSWRSRCQNDLFSCCVLRSPFPSISAKSSHTAKYCLFQVSTHTMFKSIQISRASTDIQTQLYLVTESG